MRRRRHESEKGESRLRLGGVMRHTARGVALGLLLGGGATAQPLRPESPAPTPLVIAHRGASGHLPEHTLAAYALAITMGADYVEPDLVATRDGVLVARHEPEIGATTDVAARFPARRTARLVDGRRVEGWFVDDFTLAELRTLRARERIPTRSTAHDGRYPVPTFAEVLALVADRGRAAGRVVGVYPETKHSAYFRAAGLPLEERLVAALRSPERGRTPVIIQSFSAASLQRLRPLVRALPDVRLAQLLGAPGVVEDAPAGWERPGALLTTAGLAYVRGYADAIGVEKTLVQPGAPNATTLAPATALVADAHRAGLLVHVWTLRGDAPFLPAVYGADPGAEWRRFAALGVDGMFGDFPDQGRAAFAKSRR